MSPLHLARERRGAIFLFFLLLAAAGVFAALRLPSSIFPSVTFPVIKVIADVGEEPAAHMMTTVTRPLEEAVLRVPGILKILSTTSRGSSELSGHFEWGTDMQVALQRVQGEIARVRTSLPADTQVDVEWMNTAIFPILGFAITSDTLSQSEIWALAEYRLKPELIRIPGVAQVQVQGGRRREFQVSLDARSLEARQLSAPSVVEAIRKNNQVLSAGLTEANHELYLSLVDGRVSGVDALSRIAVPLPGGGVPAHLGELGTIAAGDAVSYIRTTANGRPAVLVNIVRQPAANTVTIADGIRQLLRDQPDLLPPGVRWTTFYDQAEFVSQSVRGVRDAIWIGVALAALVLLVFLKSIRLTLIAILTIPLCVAVVLLLLSATGQTINLMTLGGIAAALGLIADDAIVVVEKIHRNREESIADPAAEGLNDLLPALVGSSLSTVVIFVPFALLTGVAGAFFRPLALTMALALVVSFLLAALVVPAASEIGRPKRAPADRKADRGRRFDRVAEFFVGHGSAGIAITIVLLAGGFLLYRAIGTDFLPAMDEGSIILDYWTPAGTSLTDTDAMLNEAEKIIQSLPDVETYSRRTGTQLGFFITEPNSGDYVIKLKPRSRRRAVDEVIDDLRARLSAAEPGIRADFGQLLEDDIGDLTGDVPQPVDVKIFGEDQALLKEKARSAAAIVRKVHGVEDVFDGIVVAGPALEIRPRARAAGAGGGEVEPSRFGLTVEDLHAAIEPAIVGTVAGTLRIGERIYDVRVFEKGEAGMASLKIRSPSGALVPLSSVVSISTGEPEAEIHRDNLKTFLGVTGRLSGRDLGGAIGEIRSKLASGLALPAGMSLQFGGLYEQQQSSFKGLLFVLIGGLLLVGVVILFEFGDWRAPLVTGLIALAVLAGVFGALILTGMTLNVSSFVGAIMMVGIVGENAVFVIQEARTALRSGATPTEAWQIAARRRLRPVAMTIFATAFALAPLALALGAGSQLQQPLAIAVIGGFLLSGPLVLLVLPGLYRLLDPSGRLAGRSSGHRVPEKSG
ncbi:MAG TPA: efflux RND transporter permease subunit [Thermoanaerobaculia bacterium]